MDDALVIDSPDGKIVVTLVSIQGDKIRLGIEAPRKIPVHRGEVIEAIQAGRPPKSQARAGKAFVKLALSDEQGDWLDRLAEHLQLDAKSTSTRERLIGEILDTVIALDLHGQDLHSIGELLAGLPGNGKKIHPK